MKPVMYGKPAKVIRRLLHLLGMILVAAFLLSGCVRDDLAITFKDANHGSITQQIRLSSQLTGVNRTAAELWLEKLTERTQSLGGNTQHPSAREWVMNIPFYNVKDLVYKFDQVFQVLTAQAAPDQELPHQHPSQRFSHLTVQTNNLLLWQRHQLSYDLDLRSLSVVPNATDSATLLINPKELLTFEFALKTPWGAKVPSRLTPESLVPMVRQRSLVWTLEPGRLNHIEALFWIPSPVGIGTVLIVGFVLAGMFLKAWTNPSSLIDLPADVAADLAQADQADHESEPV